MVMGTFDCDDIEVPIFFPLFFKEKKNLKIYLSSLLSSPLRVSCRKSEREHILEGAGQRVAPA